MFIYSKKIVLFLNEIKGLVKEVLSREVGLKVWGDRFYDRGLFISYPIKVVIYNHQNMLGYFDSNFYELGFHENLMHARREQLRNVVRHEVGHYLTFLACGETPQPHGREFRTRCQQMGWGEEVYNASFKVEGVRKCEESGVLRKVKKLMALATSSNQHEAEQAMIKSQQLLLQHNVDVKDIDEEHDEKVFLKRILKQKKKDAKMHAIANILATFFVSTVYNRAGEYTYLEILGSEVNIEIAEYVAATLQSELDTLWDHAQQSSDLRGTVAKNSFFLGLAKGYCNKIHALKRDYTHDVANALMVIEKKQAEAASMVYPHLSTIKSRTRFSQEAASFGEQMGRKLTINPAIKKSSSSSEVFLGYSG